VSELRLWWSPQQSQHLYNAQITARMWKMKLIGTMMSYSSTATAQQVANTEVSCNNKTWQNIFERRNIEE
jgi:hypothetical protein